MTITFPRTMPATAFTACDFTLNRNDAVNRTNGNQVRSIELGDPYWSIKATTDPKTLAGRAEWRAWSASLRGATRSFLAFDPQIQYPAAYRDANGYPNLPATRHGGTAFDGTCTLTGTTATTLSLSALPDGYSFSVGDHVSIGLTSGGRSLHVIVEVATGSGAGTATVSIEPPVPIGPDVSAPVQLVKATCTMVLTSFSAAAQGWLSPVSFEAVQTLA